MSQKTVTHVTCRAFHATRSVAGSLFSVTEGGRTERHKQHHH